MDLVKIKKLLEIISQSELSEVEISEADFKIKVSRSATALAPMAAPVVMPTPLLPPVAAELPPAPVLEAPSGSEVTAPLVGTFYRASAPEQPNFVELGNAVVVGQTLCIIEAMKLMNEVKSTVAGTVKKIAVENGQVVEYGQTLFVIE